MVLDRQSDQRLEDGEEGLWRPRPFPAPEVRDTEFFQRKSKTAKMTEATTTWSSLAEAWSQQTGIYSHAVVIPILLSRLIPDGELEPRLQE